MSRFCLPRSAVAGALSACLAGAAFAEGPPRGWFLGGETPQAYTARTDDAVGCRGGKRVELRSVARSAGSGTVMQIFSAQQYVGKRVQFSAHLSADAEVHTFLWSRVDVGYPPWPVSFQNSDELEGAPAACQALVVEFEVPVEASQIAVGVMLEGKGTVRMDSPKLEVVGVGTQPDYSELPARGRVGGNTWFNDGTVEEILGGPLRLTHQGGGVWSGRDGDHSARWVDGAWRVRIGRNEGEFRISKQGSLNVIEGTWGVPGSQYPVRIEWERERLLTTWGKMVFDGRRYDTAQQDAQCWRFTHCGQAEERIDLCGAATADPPAMPQTLIAFLTNGFRSKSRCSATLVPQPPP